MSAAPKRLRIAQLATSDISIRFLLMEHIRALEEDGHDVTAICAPGPWVDEIRAEKMKVQTIPMQRELSPTADLQSFFNLKRCFKDGRFNVVHTHTPKAGLLGPIAAKSAGVPVVVHTIHGLLFHDRQPLAKQLLYWLPEKLTASCSNYLLSQSTEDVGTCVAWHLCGKEKIIYLGNGIDVQRFAPLENSARTQFRRQHGFDNNDFVIGSVGRLVREKGFEELFRAAEQVRAKNPQIKFLVVGPREEGTQRDAIPEHRLREIDAKQIVRFAGMQHDMRSWYGMMDVFVLPSHREGIPRACMEAACMGLPVLATDIRGCREVVTNEQTGILVPVHDPAALAAAIERLPRDPAAARAMGQRGRERICQNFDLCQVLVRLREFYAKTVGGLAREASA